MKESIDSSLSLPSEDQGIMRLAITIFILVVLSGCASLVTGSAPVSMPPAAMSHQDHNLPSGQGWWHARFRMAWPERKQPDWYLGTMLAGEVIAPVLKQEQQNIKLWRVHRRAKRDDHGHVFSFIFYGSSRTAWNAFRMIKQNPVLKALEKDGKITWVGLDDLSKITLPEIADTSDPVWPPSVRKTWPAFIMGASRMWLELVSDLAAKERDNKQGEQLYTEVQEQLTKTWEESGQHVWLHHLSAIYAYQPLLIRY